MPQNQGTKLLWKKLSGHIPLGPLTTRYSELVARKNAGKDVPDADLRKLWNDIEKAKAAKKNKPTKKRPIKKKSAKKSKR